MKKLMQYAAVAAMIAGPAQALAEKGTVEVLAPLEISGVVYRVSTEKAMIQGSAQGILYIQNRKGSLDAMLMRCPTRNMIELISGKMEASGYCLLSDGTEDNLIFAEMNCSGANTAACKGKFKITGGTGKFKGITGSSDILMRAALSQVAADAATGTVIKETRGLAVMPKLSYSIPK